MLCFLYNIYKSLFPLALQILAVSELVPFRICKNFQIFYLKMLTPNNLKWSYKSFSLYSKLNLMPVRFSLDFLWGRPSLMDAENCPRWRQLSFKLVQILFVGQTLFVSIRTGQGVHECGRDGDWEFIPIMIILTGAYLTITFVSYFTFDSGRALNTKIYNEILKLRGTHSTFQYHFYLRDVLDR